MAVLSVLHYFGRHEHMSRNYFPKSQTYILSRTCLVTNIFVAKIRRLIIFIQHRVSDIMTLLELTIHQIPWLLYWIIQLTIDIYLAAWVGQVYRLCHRWRISNSWDETFFKKDTFGYSESFRLFFDEREWLLKFRNS